MLYLIFLDNFFSRTVDQKFSQQIPITFLTIYQPTRCQPVYSMLLSIAKRAFNSGFSHSYPEHQSTISNTLQFISNKIFIVAHVPKASRIPSMNVPIMGLENPHFLRTVALERSCVRPTLKCHKCVYRCEHVHTRACLRIK